MTSDLDINVVSGYYYIYDAKIPLKEKEFHHFYGLPQLEETIFLIVPDLLKSSYLLL